MKEQHIEFYDVDSYTSLMDMKSNIEKHIKRGWFVRTMYKPYSDYTVVVYEREVVDKSDENVS